MEQLVFFDVRSEALDPNHLDKTGTHTFTAGEVNIIRVMRTGSRCRAMASEVSAMAMAVIFACVLPNKRDRTHGGAPTSQYSAISSLVVDVRFWG
jgi:hypothetical protein